MTQSILYTTSRDGDGGSGERGLTGGPAQSGPGRGAQAGRQVRNGPRLESRTKACGRCGPTLSGLPSPGAGGSPLSGLPPPQQEEDSMEAQHTGLRGGRLILGPRGPLGRPRLCEEPGGEGRWAGEPQDPAGSWWPRGSGHQEMPHCPRKRAASPYPASQGTRAPGKQQEKPEAVGCGRLGRRPSQGGNVDAAGTPAPPEQPRPVPTTHISWKTADMEPSAQHPEAAPGRGTRSSPTPVPPRTTCPHPGEPLLGRKARGVGACKPGLFNGRNGQAPSWVSLPCPGLPEGLRDP